jgi:hypothetical protein
MACFADGDILRLSLRLCKHLNAMACIAIIEIRVIDPNIDGKIWYLCSGNFN